MSKIEQGQSFIDKVTQQTGSFENVLEMALLNGKSITEDVVIGDILIASKVTNSYVVNFLNTQNRAPATLAEIKPSTLPLDVGIGEMAIETSFIIR